jgi:8-oxo-dGTP diphosphatase
MTATAQQKTQNRWAQRLSAVIRRVPWLGVIVWKVVRWIQPRFTVGIIGILLDDTGERVLLLEHVYHYPHPWGLPGGWIDRGEDPATCIVREFHEETGLRVRVVRPLIVNLSKEWRNHLTICFLCALEEGDPDAVQLSYELSDYQWARLDDLPPLVQFHREALALVSEGP